MMTNNDSNYTANMINTILSDCSTVCTVILYVLMFGLCILSFIWSVYLIFLVIKEKKYQKYLRDLKNSIQMDVWEINMKNSQRKTAKNAFLIVICTVEWILMLSLDSMIISVYSRSVLNSGNWDVHLIDIRDCLYNTMEDTLSAKLLVTFSITFFLFLLILLKILTQYLCQEYNYFPNKSFKLSTSFKRVCLLLLSIFILGLSRYTIIIQWTLTCIAFSYEFVFYFNATRLLINLLYKRYFDAKTHENQPNYVVRYYAWTYLEFKVGSCIIMTSYFFHVMSLISFVIFSFIWFILSSPNNWVQVIFQCEKIQEFNSLPYHYQQQLHTFSETFNLVELLFLIIGWSLIVIPYLIISLKVICSQLRRSFRTYDYQSRGLIQPLIDRHNRDYYR